MERKRTRFSGKEKVAMLRRRLVDGVEVSELCEEYGIQPTVFYRWQKEFFENGELAFEKPKGKKQQKHEDRKIEALEKKLRKKDEVLAELMEEHINLKKNLGEI